MAAPLVQSTSSYPKTLQTSPVITKPTGLTTGDLMIAIIATTHQTGSATVDDPTTPAGWTEFQDSFFDGPSDTHKCFGFYKIADAGDVAASNFTFVCDITDTYNEGFLMRVDGHSATQPHYETDYDDDGSGTNPTVTVDISSRTPESLLVMSWYTYSPGVATASGYSLTGITNPTWTEQHDNADAAGQNTSFIIATAVSGNVGDITQIEYDSTEIETQCIGSLAIFPSDYDDSITPDSVSLVTTQSAPTVSADVNVTPASISLVTTQSAPTATIKQHPWTNESNNPTTWVNEEN